MASDAERALFLEICREGINLVLNPDLQPHEAARLIAYRMRKTFPRPEATKGAEHGK